MCSRQLVGTSRAGSVHCQLLSPRVPSTVHRLPQAHTSTRRASWTHFIWPISACAARLEWKHCPCSSLLAHGVCGVPSLHRLSPRRVSERANPTVRQAAHHTPRVAQHSTAQHTHSTLLAPPDGERRGGGGHHARAVHAAHHLHAGRHVPRHGHAAQRDVADRRHGVPQRELHPAALARRPPRQPEAHLPPPSRSPRSATGGVVVGRQTASQEPSPDQAEEPKSHRWGSIG